MDELPPPLPDGAAGAPPAPGVLAALARIEGEVAVAQGAATSCLSDDEHRAALAGVVRLRPRLEAAYLHLLAAFDAREGAVPGAATGRTAAMFLVHACRLDPAQAARDVKAAHAVDVDGAGVLPGNGVKADPADRGLPRMGAALAPGQISREHLDVGARCLGRVPNQLLRQIDDEGRSGAARVDAFLTDQATVVSPTMPARIARELLAVLDPDGSQSYDPEAHTRRDLTYRTDGTGMLIGRFALDVAAGAVVRAAIDAAVKAGMIRPEPGQASGLEGQGTLPLHDERTPGQRRADALTDLCRQALAGRIGVGDSGSAGERGGGGGGVGSSSSSTQVIIGASAAQVAAARAAQPPALDEHGRPPHPPGAAFQRPRSTDPGRHLDDLAPGLAIDLGSGEPLAPGTFGRRLCEAVLYPVLLDGAGAVLAAGRSTRLASPPSAGCSPPMTADASCQGAPRHRPGARPTTWSGGATTQAPTSPIWPCSAPGITPPYMPGTGVCR